MGIKEITTCHYDEYNEELQGAMRNLVEGGQKEPPLKTLRTKSKGKIGAGQEKREQGTEHCRQGRAQEEAIRSLGNGETEE